jgi:adenylate kinase family enzyme
MKQLTKIIFLLTLLFGVNFSFGQSNKLSAIVKQIAKIDEVQQEYIGFVGAESENFKNFKQLKEIATTEELVQLTDNKNATVACYASWALADNVYPGLKTIFHKFITQDKLVGTFSGCIKSQDNISSQLYNRYCTSVDDEKRQTDKILMELDSIVIYSKSPYWLLLNRALENRIYQEPYKTQISILAFDSGSKEAIQYLCKLYKAEYADKIKMALLKYLNETKFENTGTTDYYSTIEELFKFKDPKIRKAIIAKMKKDRHWEMEKERFKYILEDNYIYNIDSE